MLRNLHALEALGLMGNRLLDAGAVAIGPALPARLKALDCGLNFLGAVGARALCNGLGPRIERLDLWGTPAPPVARVVAARLPDLPQLAELDLGLNAGGPSGARCIAKSLPASLTALSLWAADMGDEGCLELCKVLPQLHGLRLLNLGLNRITCRGAAQLDLPPQLEALELGLLQRASGDVQDKLRLAPNKAALSGLRNRIQAPGARALQKRLLACPRLAVLDLAESRVLGAAPFCATLRDLGLQGCRVPPAHLAQLLPAMTRLTALELGGNLLGPAGARCLLRLQAADLAVLGLSQNRLGEAGAAVVQQVVERCEKLTLLDVSENGLGKAALERLGRRGLKVLKE